MFDEHAVKGIVTNTQTLSIATDDWPQIQSETLSIEVEL